MMKVAVSLVIMAFMERAEAMTMHNYAGNNYADPTSVCHNSKKKKVTVSLVIVAFHGACL